MCTSTLVVRQCPMYLYLTTTGRVTGQALEIEIWFTEHGDAEFNATARVVHNGREPQLAATVKALFNANYGWGDGLIVELTPA